MSQDSAVQSSMVNILYSHLQQKGRKVISVLFFSFCREKVTALEVSIAKCLEVLSTRLPLGRSDHPQQPGSTSEEVLYVFPAWHVNHFLLKLKTAFHLGGLHKFLTKELKVRVPCDFEHYY